jgi:heat shock protein HslJ
MTDEQIDARLRAAGDQWRASHTAAVVAEPPDAEQEAHALTAPAPRHPGRRWLLIASAAVVVAAVVTGGVLVWGGGNNDTPNTDVGAVPLRSTVWRLVDDKNPRDEAATLSIDHDGNVVADDSCQVIGAKVRASAGTLRFDHRIVRFKGCTDSVGEASFSPVLKVFQGTASYQVVGQTLTIRNGSDAMHLQVTSTPPLSLDVPTFVGAHWQLVRASNDSGAFSAPPRVSLYIDDRYRLTASDGGCRSLTGTIDKSLRRTDLTVKATGHSCSSSPAVGIINSVLVGPISGAVIQGYLTITSRMSVGTLVYRWAPTSTATDPARLTGTTWQLAGIGADRAVGSATLRIDRNGALSGTDGCRTFTGSAVLAHGTASLRRTFGPPTPCASAVSNQASTLDSFLGQRVVWAIRNGRLVINDGSAQAFALVYRAAPRQGK